MRIIAKSDVERLLPVGDCVEVMRTAMIAVSRGETVLPIRHFMPVPGSTGKLAVMPGAIEDPACFGIKLVAKYQRPPGDPLGTHVGMVLVFDSEKGLPLAMVEGSSLTAIRTSAASAMATDVLARKDAKRLAIMGNGEQALRHVRAMLAVRPIQTIAVWGRTPERVAAFAGEVRDETGLLVETCAMPADAARGADIICTTTSAKEAFLLGADLEPGQHINLVGSAIPTSRELDAAAVKRATYVVDYRDAALAAAGELLIGIEEGVLTPDHIHAEIGTIADGKARGRQSDDEITMYKSLGVSAQDLAAAYEVWQRALADGAGMDADLLA